jgi:hypothetical protein
MRTFSCLCQLKVYDPLLGLSKNAESDAANPIPALDGLLYTAMYTRNPRQVIPPDAVEGFSNCGHSFYQEGRGAKAFLHPDFQLSPHLAAGDRWLTPSRKRLRAALPSHLLY